MLLLIKCLMSKSPYIGLQASQVLKGMVHHFSGAEAKIEGTNKKIMLRGKMMGNQQSGNLEATNMNTNNPGDLGESMYFAQAYYEYLKYFESLYDSQNIIKPLHFFNLLNIMRSIL